ncbi:MAG: hypothetical protein GX256_07910 [Fretibacterium sp.]|nr:hypothetical protein [Fretibacterium sp.]
MNRILSRSLASVLIALTVLTAPASALDAKDLLKKGALIVGGGALVKAIADPINDFINTVTFNKNAKFEGHTKVVPIVSFGTGTHIGAAQVGGQSKTMTEKTQAVAQLEVDFKGIRVKILVPIDSINPVERFRRVQGVGVTAIIDVKI